MTIESDYRPESSAHPRKARARSTLTGLVLYLGVALLAFDDIGPLNAVGGGLVASPGWALILLAAVISPRGGPIVAYGRLGRAAWAVGLYGLVLSIGTLPFIPSSIDGSPAVDKLVRLGVNVSVWLAVLVAAPRLVRYHRTWLIAGLATAFALMLGSAAIDLTGSKVLDSSTLLHSAANAQQRVRGTRFEASALGAGLVVEGLALATFIRGRLGALAVGSAALVSQLFTQSRGTLVTTSVLIACSALVAVGGRKLYPSTARGVMALAVSLVLVVYGSSFALSSIVSSSAWASAGLVSNGTSDASRSVWADVGVQSLFAYPLGMGFTAYQVWLPHLLLAAANGASDTFSASSLTEIVDVAYSQSAQALSPKTFPAVAAVHLGVVGVAAAGALGIAAMRRAISAAKSSGYVAAPLVALGLLAAGANYFFSVFSWDQALLFGILVSIPAGNRFSDPGLVEWRGEH